MNEPKQEVTVLARDLLARLRHLHEIWNVAYLPARKSTDVVAPASAWESASPPPRVPASTATVTSDTAATVPEPKTSRAPGRRSGDELRAQAQSWSAATKLEYLRRRNLGDCQRCGLAKTRRNIVFGVGNPEAPIMFVGEAPGADEDRQGEPFVGRAGQRLDRWLSALQLTRENVYIANVLKCRPPGNRDPRPEEVDRCAPFLQAQIRAIAPRVLVALGRYAGMLLSRREDLSLRAMRQANLFYESPAKGQGEHSQGDHNETGAVRIPLIVTYHPAYVLRQAGEHTDVTSSSMSPTDELVLDDIRRALHMCKTSV